MARRRIEGSRVLVTGASSGIGQALSLELGKRRARLLLTARRRERLQFAADQIEASGSSACIIAGDITSAETRQRLIATAESEFGGLDILINNAGIGAIGPFAEADSQRLRRILEVNVIAPLELIRAAVPVLRRSQYPLIANVGSVLGHCAVPNKSEYCASKFALHGFTDSLRCELLSTGIDVLLISPNTTDSEFFDNLIQQRGKSASNPFSMSPEAVARRTISAIQAGRREVILTLSGKCMVWLDRIAPGFMSRVLARFG